MNNNQRNVPNRRFKAFETGPNWERRKVTELGKIFIGLVTTMTEHYKDEGVLLIRNSDIKDGRFEFGDNPIYLEETFAQANSSRMHKLGDVITVHTGDVGTSSVIREEQINSLGFATIVTRPNTSLITSDYLCSYLNTPQHKKWAVGVSTGDGRTNYNLGDYYECIVPVPSKEEQHKISEFISCLNNVITLHQHKLDKLKNLKKSYLAELFPAEGERLPKRRFPGFEGEWEKKKLGEIMDVGSVKRVHQSDWRVNGVRFLRARDIVSEFKNEVSNDYLYIDEELYKAYTTISGKVEKGDVLVTGVGTIGVPLLIKSDKPLYFKDGNIIWFKNKNKIDGYFFYYSFIGNTIQKFIGDVAGIGTVGTYTIDSGKNTPISLPKSKEEQILIGNFLKTLDNSITLQQQKLDKLKDLKKAYLNELFV